MRTNMILLSLAFCAGLITAFAFAAAAPAPAAMAVQIPSARGLVMTAHDASGRAFNVTAQYSTFKFDGASGGLITLDYTSDQVLCSGFGN